MRVMHIADLHLGAEVPLGRTPWEVLRLLLRQAKTEGAELILIPTANTSAEPSALFQWEIKVQAFQNSVFAAMCNRVGQEDGMYFSGESLVCGPDGSTLALAGAEETLLLCELDLSRAREIRDAKPYTQLRRPDCYE